MEIPKGHYVFGTVKVGERGQIIIPKEAREVFGIKAGDTLIVLGDEKWGIAVTKSDVLEQYAKDVFKKISEANHETE
ncbi:AbrB family transcriptional regulator [Lachnoclostridium sp. An131]|uniref:AbrB/MazE/SpoVT family DNA-binding domain-containing protein n=1 Tax=Lachnoclostridium sp. An131 TaxID=1965555 RepID=UPI000B39DB5D|nr:AbrB/MazE/SpoVT family DNA-binding domain-containing protein [Lachnoclostridium sp. An131]OUQ24404.1 AbrB family transcriptional regulator [Lachnoclostridium sp. An131]